MVDKPTYNIYKYGAHIAWTSDLPKFDVHSPVNWHSYGKLCIYRVRWFTSGEVPQPTDRLPKLSYIYIYTMKFPKNIMFYPIMFFSHENSTTRNGSTPRNEKSTHSATVSRGTRHIAEGVVLRQITLPGPSRCLDPDSPKRSLLEIPCPWYWVVDLMVYHNLNLFHDNDLKKWCINISRYIPWSWFNGPLVGNVLDII